MSADSEEEVLRLVSQLLARHPKVAIAIRLNSGSTNRRGRPVWFHKLIKGRGVVPDFVGLLEDGRGFAIECKRPGWIAGKSNGDTLLREKMQDLFLRDIERIGGVSAFVTRMETAQKLLEG